MGHRRRADDRAQASYLETLAREAGEEAPQGLTKAEASQVIDRLQARTGRGREGGAEPEGGNEPASQSETLWDGVAARAEEAGIVDQQAAAVEAIEDQAIEDHDPT